MTRRLGKSTIERDRHDADHSLAGRQDWMIKRGFLKKAPCYAAAVRSG